MEKNRRRGGAFRTAGAFAMGAAIGSVISLLYAPTSGEIARRRLAMKARGLKKAAKRRLGQTQRALVLRAGQVRETAREWINDQVTQVNGHAVRHRNGRHQPVRRTLRHAAAH
jgi:gas vesicle protein